MTLGAIKEIAKSEIRGRRLILMVGFMLTLVSWTIVAQIYLTVFGFHNVFSIFDIAIEGRHVFSWNYLLFFVFLILLYVVGDILYISYRWFGLDFLDNMDLDIKDIFQGLERENFKPVLSLVITRGAIILGWSLLFVLPGIWKAYLYSQAPNYLKEDPTLKPMEALKKSEEQMKGLCLDYFLLQFTFAPWYVAPIGLLVYGIWSNRQKIELAFEMGAETTNLILGLLAMSLFIFGIILLLFALYVEPYKMISKQLFFQEIKNRNHETFLEENEQEMLNRNKITKFF